MHDDTDEHTRVVLVRHGETDWNRAGRIQGWAPSSLTDRGRTQARRLGRALADQSFDHLVASDLQRTRETVTHLRETGVDADPTFDRGWRERDFGVYQGFTKETLFERFPAFAAENGVHAVREQPPGGESLLAARERVLDAWERLCVRAAGETALVVTHGGPLYVLLGHLKGQDLPTAVTDHSQANCAVNEVRVGPETEILRQNETVDAKPLEEDD